MIPSDDDQIGDGQTPGDQSHSDLDQSRDDQSPLTSPQPERVWSSASVDITVTFDGTWSKRGYTANYGAVVVISWDTGRVLDTHVLSKYCGKCARKRGEFPETSDEFKQWYERHEDHYTQNHSGSSPAMERDGAMVLWSRSIERLNLRYTTVVSDSDSKTIVSLNESLPYGEGVKIVKHECVGHVQKRVGKALINLRTHPPMETVEVEVKKAVKGRKATKNIGLLFEHRNQ